MVKQILISEKNNFSLFIFLFKLGEISSDEKFSWSPQRIVTCFSRVAYLIEWCSARVSLVRFSCCAATERSAKRRAMAAARVLGSALIGLSWQPSSASSYCSGSSSLLLRWQWRRLFSSSGSRLSMSLKAGIVGLPNVGKSTLFNAVVSSFLTFLWAQHYASCFRFSSSSVSRNREKTKLTS